MPAGDQLFHRRFESWVGAAGTRRAEVLGAIYEDVAAPVAAPRDVARAMQLTRWLIRRGRRGLAVTGEGTIEPSVVHEWATSFGAPRAAVAAGGGTMAEPHVLFLHLADRGWFTSSGGRALPSPLLRRLDPHPRALWAVVADGLLVRSGEFGSSAEVAFASLLRIGGLHGLDPLVSGLSTTRAAALLAAVAAWEPQPFARPDERRLSPGGRVTIRRALRAAALSGGSRVRRHNHRDLVGAAY